MNKKSVTIVIVPAMHEPIQHADRLLLHTGENKLYWGVSEYYDTDKKVKCFDGSEHLASLLEPQHMLLVSEEKIFTDDVFYAPLESEIVKKASLGDRKIWDGYSSKNIFKVLASTSQRMRVGTIPREWILHTYLNRQDELRIVYIQTNEDSYESIPVFNERGDVTILSDYCCGSRICQLGCVVKRETGHACIPPAVNQKQGIKQTKHFGVVMLPNKTGVWDKGDILKVHGRIFYAVANETSEANYAFNNDEIIEPQHLYFTSDDEVKEYDIFIDSTNSLRQAIGGQWYPCKTDKKIVASTNTSVHLPFIPESFIKKYIAYNGFINEVNLQMNNKIDVFITDECEVIVVDYELSYDSSESSPIIVTDEDVEQIIERTKNYIFNDNEWAITDDFSSAKEIIEETLRFYAEKYKLNFQDNLIKYKRK